MYSPLTLDTFKKSLKEGKYESATGARRAVGKANAFSDAERESARKAIDNHFGSSSPAKAPKAEKKTAAKKAAAKAPKAEKKAAKKSAAKTSARGKRSAKGSRKSAKSDESGQAAAVVEEALGRVVQDEDGSRMYAAERAMSVLATGLNSVTAAQERFPGSDLSSVAQEFAAAMRGPVAVFRQIVDGMAPVEAAKKAPKASKQPKADTKAESAPAPAPETAPSNGLQPGKPRAETLFEESSPQ